ncbi:hypothetical protein CDO73_12980 [Saccharibacillus sp. O23]|uniref:hypothetical protein n=1 Tax=Saccharibacillus sp. O23 TaxID=2009338 RepID=UPI000B4E25AA|nr:hypothetical protein [Saccharibacillus sp. O23]OWR29986.1 hypothetical protein CDO73_12980 [Saccharibacillus sp. O23]
MSKKFALPLVLALAVPLLLIDAPLGIGKDAGVAEAASAKQWLQISARATYYGEVAGGKPHGRGTIRWGDSKQYSGSFVGGKRSGEGKYANVYTDEETGLEHRIVYTGTWSGDRMNGSGTWREKIGAPGGPVVSDTIRIGVFRGDRWTRGYEVVHATADPDHSFSYRGADYRLDILGSDTSLLADWKSGTLFDVQYYQGSEHASYSIFQGSTAAEEKRRLAALKKLRGMTSKVEPVLRQFEAISKRLSLKR